MLRDLLGGVGTAFGLHIVAAQIAAVELFNLVFNRQAVAVPAWHVVGIKPLQLARFDNHVFEHLVYSVADVDLPVGVGRAVVQDEFFLAFARGAKLLVQVALVPLFDPIWLALGQFAPHGKRGVGQVEGGAVIDFWCGRHESSLFIAACQGSCKRVKSRKAAQNGAATASLVLLIRHPIIQPQTAIFIDRKICRVVADQCYIQRQRVRGNHAVERFFTIRV